MAAASVSLGPARPRPVPAALRAGMERLSGVSLDDVQVYRDSFRPARLAAHAFAQGNQIHLAPGQDRHLPHELAHVVQQRQGRVPVTGRVGGQPLNDDAGLEREAETMGARAGQAGSAPLATPTAAHAPATGSVGPAPVQRYRMVGEAKVSDEGQLALVAPQELYAGNAQFREANGLKGVVAFDKGPPLAHGRIPDFDAPLHRVVARLRPNAGNKFFATDAHGAIRTPTAEEVEESFASANPEGTNTEARDAYRERDDAATGIQLPSDCGFTAQHVTGLYDKGEPSPSAAMKAGSIYDYQTHDAHAEWAHHSAGVIMTDGSDHITMENAVAMASENFGKREIDRGWWYEMFGTAHGQGFEDKYAPFLPNATMRRYHKPGFFAGLSKLWK